VPLLAAQFGSAPQTRIVLTPVGGTTVAPGQSITVRVSVSGGPAPPGALITGKDLGVHVVEQFPSDIAIAIPKSRNLGPSTIGAVAGTPGGGVLGSDVLTFDVERSDLPEQLHSQWAAAPLSFDGPEPHGIPIMLAAIFADGAEPDATYSTRVTYTSSDPSIATIDARTGLIKGFSPGRATVEAVYTVGQRSVRLPFRVEVRVPAIAPSRYTVAFGEQRIGSRTGQQVTLTNGQSDPIQILGIKTLGSFSQRNDCPAELAAGAVCKVTITFSPVEPGRTEGSLQIDHSANLPYSIALSGLGVR
jgi:hypothetical protein